MKKIYVLCAVAVIALVASCKKGGKNLEQPHADITVNGTVMTEDKMPINGLMLTIETWSVTSDDPRVLSTDTVFSDANGAVSFSRKDLVYAPTRVIVTIEDVDGQENLGEFEPQTQILETKRTAEQNGQYLGAFEATFSAKMQLEEE